ncbi:glycosyltransferase family 2 protein [Sporolactobacillus laevolacticus]|uniref:Glycosyl transferase n=1 Tax=Sporolactobacillus laevolacticus DSM 442 TaxID=1395513 RepID=V6IZ13_9BACL|nr:glycosyltransferase [Sporolactobacillus laevolacticus]EST12665.1 glycosyl transferase [Sporolactobacillus laevolacticus DSM 442]
MKISFVIPVYNPGQCIKKLISCIKRFSLTHDIEIIVIDSSSNDGSTDFLVKDDSINYLKIKKIEFNHGGTRNMGLNVSSGEFIFFITQDIVIPDVQNLGNLLKPLLNNSKVGVAYGRQLPKKNADFFGVSARKINYPSVSRIKSIKSVDKLGIKTIFVSDSFAAYRRSALIEIGGFPTDIIMNEDQYVGAKLIKNEWLIAYEADACVYHSHNYTHSQEFKRYFDIGVFFGHNDWILKDFSKAEKEGAKFVLNQLKYLIRKKKFRIIPNLFVRNFMKYFGLLDAIIN